VFDFKKYMTSFILSSRPTLGFSQQCFNNEDVCRGVAGAAWATLVSQCVAVILLTRKLTGKSMQQSEGETNLSKNLPLKLGWYGLPTLEVLGPFLALAGPLIIRCALGMVCACTELLNSTRALSI
jgi:hypothetical protein